MANSQPAEIDAIKADLAALRKDIASLTKTVGETASASVDEKTAQLREKVATMREEIERMAGTAKVRGQEGVAAVERHIEDKPLQSMLIAFGAGLLLGKLFDRH
ncbi:DUF883 family protein [Oceanibaculum pacificum]|uniref:DUF883 domain-containing protein n=1 Tax=Oceanibaculum pacificum TaxID=580166 RepID=A0A154W810_9PROT|nr:DUF883 family protein [Oceanibaculum pacificum]KZD09657.1 hypothetical protein AUP43_06820 [Oceanibaculum pacificum]